MAGIATSTCPRGQTSVARDSAVIVTGSCAASGPVAREPR